MLSNLFIKKIEKKRFNNIIKFNEKPEYKSIDKCTKLIKKYCNCIIYHQKYLDLYQLYVKLLYNNKKN